MLDAISFSSAMTPRLPIGSLGGIRWQESTAFRERADRLRPRGPAMSMEALKASATYRAAVAEIDALSQD